MPRTGASFLLNSVGSSYLAKTLPISTNNIIPISNSTDELLSFSEIRVAVSDVMSRIIRRDPDTNSILATIAQGREALRNVKIE